MLNEHRVLEVQDESDEDTRRVTLHATNMVQADFARLPANSFTSYFLKIRTQGPLALGCADAAYGASASIFTATSIAAIAQITAMSPRMKPLQCNR